MIYDAAHDVYLEFLGLGRGKKSGEQGKGGKANFMVGEVLKTLATGFGAEEADQTARRPPAWRFLLPLKLPGSVLG